MDQCWKVLRITCSRSWRSPLGNSLLTVKFECWVNEMHYYRIVLLLVTVWFNLILLKNELITLYKLVLRYFLQYAFSLYSKVYHSIINTFDFHLDFLHYLPMECYQGGRRHWAVWYTSPQIFLKSFLICLLNNSGDFYWIFIR